MRPLKFSAIGLVVGAVLGFLAGFISLEPTLKMFFAIIGGIAGTIIGFGAGFVDSVDGPKGSDDAEGPENAKGNETFDRIRAQFGTLKIHERRNTAAIEKVCKKVAPKLPEDETVLFAGEGYDLVVTDRRIYVSPMQVSTPLEDVLIVSCSRFNPIRFFLEAGVPKTELLINGREVMSAATGAMPMKFLTAVLEELGKQRRRELGESYEPQDDPPAPELVAAAGVCAKREDNEIREMLNAMGAGETATELLARMREINEIKDRKTGVIMLVVGILVFLIPLAVGKLMIASGSSFVLVLQGVSVIGAVLALTGLYKTITGNVGMDVADMVDTWREL